MVTNREESNWVCTRNIRWVKTYDDSHELFQIEVGLERAELAMLAVSNVVVFPHWVKFEIKKCNHLKMITLHLCIPIVMAMATSLMFMRLIQSGNHIKATPMATNY